MLFFFYSFEFVCQLSMYSLNFRTILLWRHSRICKISEIIVALLERVTPKTSLLGWILYQFMQNLFLWFVCKISKLCEKYCLRKRVVEDLQPTAVAISLRSTLDLLSAATNRIVIRLDFQGNCFVLNFEEKHETFEIMANYKV